MSFTILRKSLPAKRPKGTAVNLVGTGTAWTAGTTFTLSGPPATGSSILTKVVQPDGLHARLAVATGSTTGTLTINDGTTTASVQVKLTTPGRHWFPALGGRR
jgi:hypothetical protein